MKVITEALLREELRDVSPEIYYIPEGCILSPAGREYLNQRKIRFAKAEPKKNGASPMRETAARFVNYETGEPLSSKPEQMTHLQGNELVFKDSPRIVFRGRLDSLQAELVLAQAMIAERGGSQGLLSELDGLLSALREIMRCDVLGEPLKISGFLGLDFSAVRERSHDPKHFYGVEPMTLPSYAMGLEYALLNRLRAFSRETELSAVSAYRDGDKFLREDIILALNRLSGALHIMMCRALAGEYR